MIICLLHRYEKDSSDIKKHLDAFGYVVEEIFLKHSEASFLQKSKADIFIFDVMNTRGESEDILWIKKIQTTLKPVLLVTHSVESSIYRESMLNAGVDSCLQVPFLKEELFIRIQKLFTKKSTLLFCGTSIVTEGLMIDIRNHHVEVEGEKLLLTKTEYSILLHLFLHKNTIVSHKELLSCLDEETSKDTLAINIHIFNLRKKIKNTHLIKTVPLYGFIIPGVFGSSGKV